MDQLSLSIVKRLKSGRRSFKEIGAELGVTENTVRSRVKRLGESGVLEVAGQVDPDALPGHRLVVIGVKLKTMNLVAKGEEFSRLRGVVSVGVVTGRFDLIVVAMLNQEFDLLQFYTQEVSRVDDVLSTETFVLYKNFNWKAPYVI